MLVVSVGLASMILFPISSHAVQMNPRHCHGSPKHIHLSVGRDPTTQMTVSFATKWGYPGVEAPVAGLHVGTAPHQLDRWVPEHEEPVMYTASMGSRHGGELYYAPFQHHITIEDLQPNTTYYYVIVSGDRDEGVEVLGTKSLRDHPTQHVENWIAETAIMDGVSNGFGDGDEGDAERMLRRLAPPPYDGHEKDCVESHRVRSFRTAPVTNTGPVTFAIIGDLGQFDHSKETLTHIEEHREGIDAVILGGDIAYTGFDPRGWDTFFDFLDDYSIFGEIPLMIANGNHDIEKVDDSNEIFQAYEWRFRMPQVKPAVLGLYDGPPGLLNMDAPPYPLPYEWGNAYYSFDYGPAKHIIVSAYSSMEPDSEQYQWLVDTMEAVDRSTTPWVLVTIHVPIYNTFALHKHDLQIFAAQEHLEPLLVKYNVNLVFTGHIHAYQRTSNVALGNVTATGPIHITIGAGGRKCDAPFKTEEPEEWVVKRDASYYGYGRLDIFNHTHAQWKWIPLSPSDLHDYNTVKGEEIHLPQLQHDELMIENQYFAGL